MSSLLIQNTEGPVRILTLDRPAKRNALNTAIQDALFDALRAAEADPSVACVLLLANGPVFCAGADMAEHNDPSTGDPAVRAARVHCMARLLGVISQMGTPVVAAVQGAAIGAGAGLALSADFVLLAQSAKLGYPEVPHGMVPALMVPALMGRLSPRSAFELLILGEMIDARQALAAGLVNRVVADGDLVAEARALAQRLGAMSPDTVAATKKLFHEVIDQPLEQRMAAGLRAALRSNTKSNP